MSVSYSSNFEEFMESDNHLKSLDGKTPYIRKRKGVRMMYLAAFSALFISLAMGLISGYSAPATYDMKSRSNSAINPNEKEIMWIGSSLAIGLIIGSLVAGPLADKIGRKDILIYNIIPFGFGWLIICYSTNFATIILGRLLNGLACGIICCAVPMYCIEIATAEVRGLLGSGFQGFLVIGNLLSVTVGAFISWKFLALQGAIFSIVSVMIFCLMPETPRWYLMKNDLPSAIRSMNKLQNGFVDAEKECKAIYEDLQNQPKGSVTWAELVHPTAIKPGLITLALMFFQQFSGINAVFLYSSEVFEVSKDFIDPKMATIIIGAVQVFATLISNFIVDKAGRKILLIISGALMGVSFAVFGAYYYMTSVDVSIKVKYGWIPLSCSISSVIGYSFGYGPLPFLLSAEMLSVRVRSTISAIVHFFDGIFVFIITNTFSDVEDLMHNYGAFWFYSICSFIGVIFVIIFVPETKGKRLEEIQEIFDNKPAKQNINISVIS